MADNVVSLDHARASRTSRAAKVARSSAVTPAAEARSVARTVDHHSAGTLLRCHHLETAEARAPISAAIASREVQSSMTDRNEVKSDMTEHLRHLVLKRKDNLSADMGITEGHNVLMSRKPPESEFKRQFLARTAIARDKAGYTQETMAGALGMEQSKYSKYEVRTALPHHLIVQFCSLCEITTAWLYTAAVEVPAAKPRRRRKAKKLKVA
jgi:DNA-binding XRE family transcriptional regulator